MVTQKLTDGLNHSAARQSGTLSASTSCDGSASESTSSPLMGDYYREADPINLCRAICVVYDRWIKSGKKPGSDSQLHCTRSHRPALVAEITAEWERIAEADPHDDLFPYHESYVIRKWIAFRKMTDYQKSDWIAASLELDA